MKKNSNNEKISKDHCGTCVKSSELHHERPRPPTAAAQARQDGPLGHHHLPHPEDRPLRHHNLHHPGDRPLRHHHLHDHEADILVHPENTLFHHIHAELEGLELLLKENPDDENLKSQIEFLKKKLENKTEHLNVASPLSRDQRRAARRAARRARRAAQREQRHNQRRGKRRAQHPHHDGIKHHQDEQLLEDPEDHHHLEDPEDHHHLGDHHHLRHHAFEMKHLENLKRRLKKNQEDKTLKARIEHLEKRLLKQYP